MNRTIPKNQINAYNCPACGRQTITKDINEGTTPFMLGCRATQGCRGMAESSCYRADQTLEWSFEWYKPTLNKAKREDRKFPGMLDHFEAGGLFLRARERSAEKPRETSDRSE